MSDNRQMVFFAMAAPRFRGSTQRHLVVETKRDAEAIKAGPKIGSAGWDADDDLLHLWQTKVGPQLPRESVASLDEKQIRVDRLESAA